MFQLTLKISVGQQRSIFTGAPVHTFQSNTDHKALQILSFMWPETIEQFQSFTIGGEVEFRFPGVDMLSFFPFEVLLIVFQVPLYSSLNRCVLP
jgi:hypothetical protein